MRLHWLTLWFKDSKLEDGFQRHSAASFLPADAWCLLALLLGLLLWTLHMRLSFAVAEDAAACSSGSVMNTSSRQADTCSMEQQQQRPVLVQQLRMGCTAGAAMCGLACMAALLLRQLRRAWYVQHRTGTLAACSGLTAALLLCGRAAVLQAGISSSTACILEALGVLLFAVYAMPFAWALPAVAGYWAASAWLLQTAGGKPDQLLLSVLPLGSLYVLERHARLSFWKTAAAAAFDDVDGCCRDGDGCDTADRTPSGSEQQSQHHHPGQGQQQRQHHRLRQPMQAQHHQQQQGSQRGMAVLAPVTLPAESGAVPVPASLGYSSVFQRSVLAIKVEAPTTANYDEIQQVQQRIAATLRSALTTSSLPAVLAGTIAFPGCVHVLCTFASQPLDLVLNPQQQGQPKGDNDVGSSTKRACSSGWQQCCQAAA
ncbi:hypothetical protein COO60DRAFT_489993 [Scenedesmus sp. NREL 46B-D3]|nr:hypothetical protein COO60DRAFT_489993 [Scenedesmus sp. NREL 46B-D3]